jgi:hypothetical protein
MGDLVARKAAWSEENIHMGSAMPGRSRFYNFDVDRNVANKTMWTGRDQSDPDFEEFTERMKNKPIHVRMQKARKKRCKAKVDGVDKIMGAVKRAKKMGGGDRVDKF